MIDADLNSVAWRGARGYTRWHLELKQDMGRTLCVRRIPQGVQVTRRATVITDCEGCEAVYRYERFKMLQTSPGQPAA